MGAEALWADGYSGKGIKVGIFDTGLDAEHSHFKNIEERSNWTEEPELKDQVGHGTFVAGVVASTYEGCHGFAVDAELHIFKLFTSKQVSFTSWYLDAFNYAIHTGIQIINLSIGGPDFMDIPFVDKVNELTANGVIMVAAIGNDGPVYGSLNNPGDMPNVIGVGGMDYDHNVAPFSSRGMSLRELPAGYGRFKPDVVSYGVNVVGSTMRGGCHGLSGTSVASPVITGAATLLASVVPPALRQRHLNPASLKQALTETAIRVPVSRGVPQANVFAQGQGRVNLTAARDMLLSYQPRASILPSRFDTTDCPYSWPYCTSSLFYGSRPMTANFTILNGMAATGWLESPPVWRPSLSRNGTKLSVELSFSSTLWPWSGWLAMRVVVADDAAGFVGAAEGVVQFVVRSAPAIGADSKSDAQQSHHVTLPVRIKVVAAPPRRRRLLWDQFHSIAYPAGYFPRDDLRMNDDPLDWNGDHPHTNFRGLFEHLVEAGYHIDVLDAPFLCFDATDYAALLVVDPEEEYFKDEVVKLKADVEQHGLGLVVLADWYSVAVMEKVAFEDENTRNWWFPETGGANVPALNELLGPWGIELASSAYDGQFLFGDETVKFLSGVGIKRFPVGGTVLSAWLKDFEAKIMGLKAARANPTVLGYYPAGAGRVVVYGDSNCADDSHAMSQADNTRSPRCFGMVDSFIRYATTGVQSGVIQEAGLLLKDDPMDESDLPSATRSPKATLHVYSKVLGRRPTCPKMAWAQGPPIPDAELEAVLPHDHGPSGPPGGAPPHHPGPDAPALGDERPAAAAAPGPGADAAGYHLGGTVFRSESAWLLVANFFVVLAFAWVVLTFCGRRLSGRIRRAEPMVRKGSRSAWSV